MSDKQIFNALDYAMIHQLAFNERINPGYKPKVREAPNGDGKIDYNKRYAHIAKKYLAKMPLSAQAERQVFENLLARCQQVAIAVAVDLGIPQPFWPDLEDSMLRVLEYNETAGAEPHIDDPCLFTLMAYRNLPQFFEYMREDEYETKQQDVDLYTAQKFNTQVHYGGLMPLVVPGVQPTRHRVRATEKKGVWQYSAVFFAMPKLSAVLPDGQTVGDRTAEIIAKMRY